MSMKPLQQEFEEWCRLQGTKMDLTLDPNTPNGWGDPKYKQKETCLCWWAYKYATEKCHKQVQIFLLEQWRKRWNTFLDSTEK